MGSVRRPSRSPSTSSRSGRSTSTSPRRVALHTMWPDGCVSLSIVANGGVARRGEHRSALGCARSAPRCAVGSCVRGVRLWPDTAASVLGVDPVAIRDSRGPPRRCSGSARSRSRAPSRAPRRRGVNAVWESWLAPRIAGAALPDPDVRFVVRRLIDSTARSTSPKRRARRGSACEASSGASRAAVGLSPKQFARVRRVRAAIGAIVAGERGTRARSSRSGLEPRRSRVSSGR